MPCNACRVLPSFIWSWRRPSEDEARLVDLFSCLSELQIASGDLNEAFWHAVTAVNISDHRIFTSESVHANALMVLSAFTMSGPVAHSVARHHLGRALSLATQHCQPDLPYVRAMLGDFDVKCGRLHLAMGHFHGVDVLRIGDAQLHSTDASLQRCRFSLALLHLLRGELAESSSVLDTVSSSSANSWGGGPALEGEVLGLCAWRLLLQGNLSECTSMVGASRFAKSHHGLVVISMIHQKSIAEDELLELLAEFNEELLDLTDVNVRWQEILYILPRVEACVWAYIDILQYQPIQKQASSRPFGLLVAARCAETSSVRCRLLA